MNTVCLTVWYCRLFNGMNWAKIHLNASIYSHSEEIRTHSDGKQEQVDVSTCLLSN
jgi:hypothetical protein